MNITVTITHNVAPEVLSLLEKFVSNLPAEKKQAPVKQMKNSDKPVEEPPAKDTSSEAPAETSTSNEPKDSLTIEQVRAEVKKASEAGKKENVKALLVEFGTPNVTGLPVERFGEFVTRLKAI